ncbi:MAG: hypothetical protein JXR51_04480 [Bacteroidales bacterium]|nr:hypothetical protein [Bacteroidales bacterium]MBN2756413.1 hypothetical protein [Bacteroidales bacterium]
MKMKFDFSDKSLIILLAVNLFPIFGVFFLNWDSFEIIFLYVVETFIIGFINVLKMSKKEGIEKFFLIPFFIFHYNFFILIQSIFVVIFWSIGNSGFDEINENFGNEIFYSIGSKDFIIAVLLIIFSHSVSFYKNYIKNKEFLLYNIGELMFLPYKRIIIQQITVIGGAFIILLLKAPIGFLIIFIVLKIYFDMRAHFKSHSKTIK